MKKSTWAKITLKPRVLFVNISNQDKHYIYVNHYSENGAMTEEIEKSQIENICELKAPAKFSSEEGLIYVFEDGTVMIGDCVISKKDSTKLFKELGKSLGYVIS